MKLLPIVAIFLIGVFLRLFLLGSVPDGVTADEIQQAYTGYSILNTGRDEWGDFLPLNPRSLGEYKLPLYGYLTIPFEVLFGLNILSTRLPSAIFGSLTVLLLYFLAKSLFESRKIALIASAFLAISGWHIIYSRIGWESNIGLPLFLLGLLLFLKSLKTQKLLPLSAVFFCLGTFTYWSFKVFIPLFVLGLLIFYRRELMKFNKKVLIITLSIFLVTAIFVIQGWIFSGSGRRASDAAIYNQDNLGGLRQLQVEDRLPNPWNRIINNKISFIFSEFVQNYLGYFSTTFLISPHRSESTLFNLPGGWLIPLWQFLTLIIGAFWLIKNQLKYKKIIFLWILLAAVPAALTKEYMHTQRVEVLLLIIPLISAFGVSLILDKIKKRYLNISIILIVAIIFISFIKQADYYTSHQFNRSLGGLKFGYEEAITFTESQKEKYDKIIFTKQNSNPQIFLAFYTKIDPITFQNYSKEWVYFEKEGFKFVDMIDMQMGKYYFRNIDFSKERNEKNSLIIGTDEEISGLITPIKTIKDPSGKIIFEIVDTNTLAE